MLIIAIWIAAGGLACVSFALWRTTAEVARLEQQLAQANVEILHLRAERDAAWDEGFRAGH